MAVAVKNTPETVSASMLDRMAVVSLAGTAYALGTLGIVFYLVPSLWNGFGWDGIVSTVVRGLLQLVVLGGLIVFGARLLGPRTATGVRAGIFVGLVGVLLILLLTRWASLWIEYWSFERGLYTPTVGAILTAVVGVALLVLGVRFLLQPAGERFLLRLEEQGWFSARPYKALQGVRVRRGTIFGILILVGAGIWTLLAHNTLRKGASDWQLNIPFTGQVTMEYPGDAVKALSERFPDWEAQIANHSLVLDRYLLREINQSVNPETHVKIFEPGASSYSTNEIVDRISFNETVRKLKENGETLPKTVAPQPAGGATTFRTLTLLPAVQFTVPLLLLAASLWLAWRVVNMPVFADFLIATEAEMNKVSWTTQRRLVQDTIVVLVTVVLMAFYLFSMDMVWKHVLSWKPIGVLHVPDDQQTDTNTNVENRPW
jgi:preprotein translocase SecE subunit